MGQYIDCCKSSLPPGVQQEQGLLTFENDPANRSRSRGITKNGMANQNDPSHIVSAVVAGASSGGPNPGGGAQISEKKNGTLSQMKDGMMGPEEQRSGRLQVNGDLRDSNKVDIKAQRDLLSKGIDQGKGGVDHQAAERQQQEGAGQAGITGGKSNNNQSSSAVRQSKPAAEGQNPGLEQSGPTQAQQLGEANDSGPKQANSQNKGVLNNASLKVLDNPDDSTQQKLTSAMNPTAATQQQYTQKHTPQRDSSRRRQSNGVQHQASKKRSQMNPSATSDNVGKQVTKKGSNMEEVKGTEPKIGGGPSTPMDPPGTSFVREVEEGLPPLQKEDSKLDRQLLSKMTSEQQKVKVNIKNFAPLQKKEIKLTYKIKETLGQGSFGCVKRVLHRDLNEDRALKILKRTSVTSESDFGNEIGMLKSIDHPNVLKYYECYMDEFNYYIVTEYCPGGELLSFIVKERGINDWQAAYIMKQVLSAVNYCHARGIVHRDLKVENVLVKEVKDGENEEFGSRKRINVKLIDFGISCKIKPHQRLNKFFGTPYYMAPEVIKRDYTEKCDLWATGVILYIIMCGYPPFRAQTLKGLQKVILEGKYDFRDQFWGEVWPETKDLIKKLLVVDQNKRLSAKEALSHPFFEALRRDMGPQLRKQDKQQMSQAFQNLRNFNAEAKIQTALKAYLANFCIQDDYEQELNRVFQEIDRNRDGTISKNEFRNGTYQFFGEKAYMLEEEVDRIFDLVDMNGNGVIDYSEFISSAANVNQLISEKQMKAAFKAFDLDGNGEISFEEFEETFSAGLEIEKDELRSIFVEFDHNKNGLINFEEFKNFMKKIFKVINNKLKQVQIESSP